MLNYFKDVKTILIILLCIVILVLRIKTCSTETQHEKMISELKNKNDYFSEVNKNYRERIQKDSSTIITQQQVIVSKMDAVNSGMLELFDKMDDVKSQIKQNTIVKIVDKPIPFIPTNFADTSGWVRNSKGEIVKQDSISVPQAFKLEEKWFSIEGEVTKKGLNISELSLPNKQTLTIGERKKGFLNLGREKVVQIKNDNPYIKVDNLENIVIKDKKPFFKNPIFILGVGLVSGVLLTK